MPSNDQHCPLCHQPNQCAVAIGEPGANCWCQSQNISEHSLAEAKAIGDIARCICAECASPKEIHRV